MSTHNFPPIFASAERKPAKTQGESTCNPLLRTQKLAGWVNYFRVGNASRAFSEVRDYTEIKLRNITGRPPSRPRPFFTLALAVQDSSSPYRSQTPYAYPQKGEGALVELRAKKVWGKVWVLWADNE